MARIPEPVPMSRTRSADGSPTFGAAAKGPGNEVVRLDKFVVSNEREGNAKAIMEQRAALNMKSVVASDNFGDVTGGNIGEFMKYLPGVVIDYNNADARAVRISLAQADVEPGDGLVFQPLHPGA